MKLLAILAAVLIAPQEKNEAEELYKKMEAKILEAKTIQARLQGSMIQDTQHLDMRGELLLGEKNQARYEITTQIGSTVTPSTAVTDGKKMALVYPDGKGAPTNAAIPEKFGRLMRVRLARAGVVAATEAMQVEKLLKEDPATTIRVRDFKLGAKEKVAWREAQQVEYRMTKAGEPDRAATVWIDLETHLPLKRVLRMGPWTVTERYLSFSLDEKIEPSKFELPWEAK